MRFLVSVAFLLLPVAAHADFYPLPASGPEATNKNFKDLAEELSRLTTSYTLLGTSTVTVSSPLTGSGSSGSPLGVDSTSVTLQGNTFNLPSKLAQFDSGGRFGVGTSTTQGHTMLHVTGYQSKIFVRRSEVNTTPPPGTPTTSALDSGGSYIHLGGHEYGVGTLRLMTFGFHDDARMLPPGYVGYEDQSAAGFTNGDIIIAARPTTANVESTVGIRLRGSDGNVVVTGALISSASLVATGAGGIVAVTGPIDAQGTGTGLRVISGSTLLQGGAGLSVTYGATLGSATVSNALTVVGTATVVGNAFSVGGSSFSVAGGSATVAYGLTAASINNAAIQNGAIDTNKLASGSVTVSKFQPAANGASGVVMQDSSGRVGIGNPQAATQPLSVETTGTGPKTLATLTVPNAVGNNATLDFSVNAAGTIVPVTQIVSTYTASGTVGLSFNTFGSSALRNSVMITGDGLVGVNTVAPTTALSVYGVITSSTAIPSFTCNAGTPVGNAVSTNQHGRFVAGASAANCTVTFSTAWPKAPACFCNDETTVLAMKAVATTTTLVCTVASTMGGDTITYGCMGAP